MLCLCFFGFLRWGEITCPSECTFDPFLNLCFSDVRVDNQSIKASKTDPFRQGLLHICVAGGLLSPVAAVLSYMQENHSKLNVAGVLKDVLGIHYNCV